MARRTVDRYEDGADFCRLQLCRRCRGRNIANVLGRVRRDGTMCEYQACHKSELNALKVFSDMTVLIKVAMFRVITDRRRPATSASVM